MGKYSNEPVAIIGTGCRFPGGSVTPSKFWDLLKKPKDLCREIPQHRFDVRGFYHQDPLYHGHSNVLNSYTLEEDPRLFDAQFFGIKPVEANAIDPQQRLLLETVYESIESAGLRMEDLQGSNTAVYVGLMCNDYEAQLLRDFSTVPAYHVTGIARSIMSNRISYFFDFRGPSMTIDTACSSSLVAVHQAVQTLRAGDSNVAIACGSNLLLGPENYVSESKLKLLSPSGRSRMWDKSADGYARGDGIAAITLKLLRQAVRDGDHVECLIRETGTNQDGRTKGITMPSPVSQAALIRDTYAKAGLDPRKEQERCQYFEAHGTGTQTGDPIEAEAIKSAFFGPANEESTEQTFPLYVGSVKTTIGHTEGTAGLAAVIKASLALQHMVIPPNMLFEELNPAIRPFYSNLCIPTEAKSWPLLPEGTPRRISVNSFGFGGSNAHVILESYEPTTVASSQDSSSPLIPFLFSALTEKALKASLAKYSEYLRNNTSLNMQDLAWNLQGRRSQLPIRAALCASSAESLRIQIDDALNPQEPETSNIFVRTMRPESSRVIGIFTGQGAQYAGMAAGLYSNSSFVRDLVEHLEQKLASLPDPPLWSLKEELLADAESSRVHEAALSQPLCTVVQIILVDMLHLAGVRFDAVVGHSSGEIGAAYAAGMLTKDDAICISYYRGKHSRLACGAHGQTGAMLAVGTFLEDAEDLCRMDEFQGRITVAAVNSPASVTLSGDEDAISEAKIIFEDEKKFVRKLKVDKAYHSYHMRACSQAYIKALQECDIRPRPTSDDVKWYSSVTVEEVVYANNRLKSTYWDDNMVQPVLFAPAIRKALSTGAFDLALEVGPHPALKGPASQVIQETTGESIRYTSFLSRGESAVVAFVRGLGDVWTHLHRPNLKLEAFQRILTGCTEFKVLKNLPSYSFDHDRPYWHESRSSKVFRTNSVPVHELLGSMSSDSTTEQLLWKHILRPKEIPWIQGHQLQDQVVFPAAGYISSAFEASKALVDIQNIRLIEMEDFNVRQALVFDANDNGVEVLISLTDIERHEDFITAAFLYHSAVGSDTEALTLMASGKLRLVLGEPSSEVLPGQGSQEPNMTTVEDSRFYSFLETLGYGYTGPFKALTAMKRKLGKATGSILSFTGGLDPPLMAHPASLDAAIQAVILAFCYPNDGQLWSLHVPTGIQRICINPALRPKLPDEAPELAFSSAVSSTQQSEIYGDVNIFPIEGTSAFLQLEGVRCVPFSPPTSADDVELFSHMLWDVAEPNGQLISHDTGATTEDYELASVLERVALFYLRCLSAEFKSDHTARLEGPYVGLFNYAEHVIGLVSSGKHPYARKDWLADSHENIMTESKRFPVSPDLRIMHIVGQQMPRVLKNQTTILEHLLPDGLLDDYYVNALGFPQFSIWLARMAKQLTHRYPHMDIIEIGAGTGGATKSILKQIGKSFSSYTFTDISNGFFSKAQEVFEGFEGKMIFKALDIEKDVVSQGFTEGSFDLVVASFVIHATARLEPALKNLRRLLKPGGFALLAEVTNNDQIRGGFIFGALPGWWLGAEDGRVLSPCVSPVEWDDLLRKSGFSGIDAITPDDDRFPYPGSVFLTQALDDRISFLRQPMFPIPNLSQPMNTVKEVIIIGGNTLATSRLVAELRDILKRYCTAVKCIKAIETPKYEFTVNSVFLSLVELDNQVFEELSPSRFESLKQIFGYEKTLLWLTRGRRADRPYSNMTLGFARSQFWEVPDLRVQFVDVESSIIPSSQSIAEMLLRFAAKTAWEKEDSHPNILYSNEPEVIIDTNERHLIPRLYPIVEANDRYNSARRSITQPIDSKPSAIEIVKATRGYDIRGVVTPSNAGSTLRTAVKVSYSTALSVRTPAGFRFVVFGTLVNSGKSALALSFTASSTVYPLEKEFLECEIPTGLEVNLLSTVAANFTAMVALSDIARGQALLVHEPDLILATVITRRASERGVRLALTSCSETPKHGCVIINPYAPRRSIQSKLPHSLDKLIDLSLDTKHNYFEASIWAGLPFRGRILGLKDFYSHIDGLALPLESDFSLDGALMKDLYALSREDLNFMGRQINSNSITLDHISQDKFDQTSPSTIVDWTGLSKVNVIIQPVSASISFPSNKTYWLVGLSGGLGLSLCEWMIQHGARHFVISSRNPKVDDKWLEQTKEMGAEVKICANDITDQKQVQELYQEITANLPPIAGVAQGAMVLDDIATRDMTYEQMMKVLRPKVDGTAQRRKRGLSGSAIDIGVIIGAGYVTREVNHAGQENLRKGGYMWMSEGDFHQIFAEAVLAGKGESTSDLQISTGLRHANQSDAYLPIWFNNPKFANFVRHQTLEDKQESDKASSVPIKTRLLEAKRLEDVVQIVRETFLSKLQNTLQLQDTTNVLDTRTDDLGIDSLVAVEVRSWFYKNYQISIPVLKILGGSLIKELIDHAAESIPEDLIPAVQARAINTDQSQPQDGQTVVVVEPSIPSSVKVPFNEDSIVSGHSLPREAPSTTISSGSDTPLSSIFENPSLLDQVQPEPIIQRSEAMSFGQEMFWFVHNLLDDKTTLNHTGLFRLNGSIRVGDLKMAVDTVAHHHESLRTCFFINEEQQACQGILEASCLELETREIESENDARLEFSNLKQCKYNLSSGLTMRIILLTLSPISHYLLIGCHHICIDGTSHQVLMADILKAYSRCPLKSSVLQYPTHSARQRSEYKDGLWRQEISYWKKEFECLPQSLPLLNVCLPTSRRTLTRYAVHRSDFRVPVAITDRIRSICKANQSTAFHFYLSVFNFLLFRCTGAQDICVGIGDNNRTENDILESIGAFVNILPLRFRFESAKTFTETLKQTRLKAYSALANSKVPFEVLLNELRVPRSSTHSPLFQTFVDYRQGTQEKTTFGAMQLELLEFEAGRTAYDVSLDIIDNKNGDALLMLMVQQDLYTDRDAKFLMKTYVSLLDMFANFPTMRLEEVPKYQKSDQEAGLMAGKGVAASLGSFLLLILTGSTFDTNWPDTLIHRIEDMIIAHREEPAISEANGRSFTYEQIGQRIDSIVAALYANKVVFGDYIAVLQEPSIDWVCSMLAILKAGAIYVPLDLSIPAARLNIIVSDCQPILLLVHEPSMENLAHLNTRHAKMVNVSRIISLGKATGVLAKSNCPAVVLYTSGSTGTPKGITLSHANFLAEVEVSMKIYGLEREVVLQQSALSFDMSVLQIFLALALGGRLCMMPRSMRGDSSAITRYMIQEHISFTCATPAEYASWLRNSDKNLCSSAWKVALSGGEAFTESLLRSFRELGKSDLRLFNGYGPTETTCCSTKIELTHFGNGRIPAGFASPNESIYILDEDNKDEIVSMGLPGEVAIGGVGVAQRYLNDETLSKSSFVKNIFATKDYIRKGWTTMYRTGDRGRLLEDGSLLLEGRKLDDTQIKLRGVRIDLRDIEDTIIRAAGGSLSQAAVSLRNSDAHGQEFLVAHVVFAANYSTVDRDQFLRSLLGCLPLPRYMIPAVMLHLEEMPVTVSSKVDRLTIAALPIPQQTFSLDAQALSHTEKQLGKIWEDLLDRELVGRSGLTSNTDFFHAGGNSMLLVDVQRHICSEFDVSIPLVQLFESCTLGSMADRIESGSHAKQCNIDWNKETALSRQDPFEMLKDNFRRSSIPKTVVLTGAAGFLGQFILQQLVNASEVERIFCVAVRRLSSRRSLFDSPKVVAYEGDLALPLLGLTRQDAVRVFSEADVVIHNGADISHLKHYSTLKPANFESTKELVRLSISRMIPFHYVSTAGVSMFTVRSSFGEVSVRPDPPPIDGSDGYTATKWASEIYLENASQQYGLPVWIHRPSSIVQPIERIRDGSASLDMLQNLLKYSKILRAVPFSANLKGSLDLVYPENVSRNIVRDVLAVENPEGIHYRNHTGDVDLPIDGMKEHLEKNSGESYDRLPIRQWASLAESKGLHSALAALFGNVDDVGVLSFPEFIKDRE